jgi:hypothetical protein
MESAPVPPIRVAVPGEGVVARAAGQVLDVALDVVALAGIVGAAADVGGDRACAIRVGNGVSPDLAALAAVQHVV